MPDQQKNDKSRSSLESGQVPTLNEKGGGGRWQREQSDQVAPSSQW